MTINFKFHNHRKKDGTQSLQIRIRDGNKEKLIKMPGVALEKRFWDSKSQMVKTNHPNSEVFNKVVSSYHEKIRKVKPLYELNQISFNEVVMMLQGSGSIDSLLGFMESVQYSKSKQWYRNTQNAVKRFGYFNNLDNPSFKDLTYSSLEKMVVELKRNGNQPETINNYLSHLRALFNYGKKKKVTHYDFEFPNDLMAKTRRHDKKLKTHTPVEVAQAIDRIVLKDQSLRSKESTLRDFEAIGFWLLMFCMRGLYGKDITSLSSKSHNYDYSRQIEHTIKNKKDREVVPGNYHFIDHKRHKTNNNMRIWITLPPIGGLITVLRRLVAQTHPHVSYLTTEDLEKDYVEMIKRKNYDGLKIFRHNPKTDLVRDEAIWNNLNKHLKRLGLHSFESARKSFATTCSTFGIDSSIERQLLGQSDPSILKHYVNFEDKRLIYVTQQSHLIVLKNFRAVELFDLWLQKMYDLFGFDNDYQIGASSDRVYEHFSKTLPSIINLDKSVIAIEEESKEGYSLKLK